MAETKQAVRSIGTQDLGVVSHVKLIPDIQQGAGDNQRIGNKIQTRWFTLNFYIKIGLSQLATNNEHDVPIRIYVAWPKTTSESDTVAQITAVNFPLHGLPTQDGWFYWKDRKYFLNTSPEFGRRDYINLKMYKKFRFNVEYATSNQVIAQRSPYLIVARVTDINVVAGLTGYCKVSYKDI